MGLARRSFGGGAERRRRRTDGPVAVALLGGLPLCLLAYVLSATVTRRGTLEDFRIFRGAGAAVLAGRTPYVAPDPALLAGHDRFVYPAPVAFLFAPFSLVSLDVARAAFLVLTAAALVAALWLLEVRDWRCYGVSFLLAPVLDDLVLGAMSSFLLLGAAAAWRLRNRLVPVAVVVAVLVLAKLALWPLLLWLVATRRRRAAASSIVLGSILAVAGWAAIGFAGLADYPELLRVLARVESRHAYSVTGLLSAHGVESVAVPALLALLGAAAVLAAGRRGRDERVAFGVAVAVSLLASPIVWLHYFVLLLAPIALARPYLSPLWLAPLALWVSPWPHADGGGWRTAVVLVLSGAILAVSAALPAGLRLPGGLRSPLRRARQAAPGISLQ